MTADEVHLTAPDHFRYEVPNALRTAVRRQRMTVHQATRSIENLFDLGIEFVDGDDLIVTGSLYAFRYNIALYDALYLVLADRANAPFVHADRRLSNSLRNRFAHATWIEDLRL